MPNSDVIPTHSLAPLQDYYSTVARPGWRPWYRAIDEVKDVELTVGATPIKLSGIATMFRNWTLTGRAAYAAYHWLRPLAKMWGLKELPALLREAGLDHLDTQAAVAAITDAARAMSRKHPRLDRWIGRRTALLDLHAQAFSRSQHPTHELVLLRHGLCRLLTMLPVLPADAIKVARDTCATALRGAARAAQAELSPSYAGTLNASLMVPVNDREAAVACLSTDTAHARSDRAADLWRGLPTSPERFLVVVAETMHNEHTGFWVPIVHGDGRQHLPGGPQALNNQRGSAVLMQDLPVLEGFPESLNERWRAYVADRVRGRLFVSLPLVMPHSHADPSFVVPAVVNVNAAPADGEEWYRAYHVEWLERARDAAAPFVEVALYAFLATQAVRGDAALQLDAGSSAWDTLPGFIECGILEGGSDDGA